VTATTSTDAAAREPSLPARLPLLALLSAGAAAIHFAMMPAHFDESAWLGLGFAAAAWFQVGWALLAFTRPTERLLWTGIVVNALILGVYVASRTSGLPIGSHAGEAESWGFVDLLAAGLEVAVVLGAAALLIAGAKAASWTAAPAPVVAIAGIGVLALTTAAIASPSAREHHDEQVGHTHGAEQLAAGAGSTGADGTHADDPAHAEHADEHAEGTHVDDHGHDGAAPGAASEPCDLDLNPASYYEEAELAGVMSSDHSAHGGDHGGGHGGGDAPEVSEIQAAIKIVELAGMSDDEYREVIRSLDAERSADAPDDTTMGGHLGPQTWVHLTDSKECAQLRRELDTARRVALSMMTPADAIAAGYTQVTPYVPGIAAHYMNFSYVDDRFEVDKPEMVLYDGSGPEARVVGLSYYIVHNSESEPTDGFTGDSDHYHRHVGLCVRGTMVIGDSATTKEECEARGGVKQEGRGGWMSHAWVVPGCESPWGIFSAANPILDDSLPQHAAQGAPCSGSGVLDRYDLSPGPPPSN
jgi:hypothetical protein